ncbi:ATP-binding protein [Roseomonas sp. WA12]
MTPPTNGAPLTPGAAARLFAGPGTMRALCRAHDWAATPLGPVESWDQSLRATTRTLLASRYPMILIWGEHFIQIYNDAYAVVIGDKHPAALGIDIRITLAEAWNTLGPMIAEVMSTGLANWVPAQQLLLNRSGYAEEAYFSLSHAPAENDAGTVVGMLCVCSEVTQQVIGDRRLRLLRDLAGRTGDALSVEESCCTVAEVLHGATDIPFATIHLRAKSAQPDEPADETWRIAASTGLPPGAALPPELPADQAPDWFRRAAAGETAPLSGADAELPWGTVVTGGPWGHPVTQAVALPLAGAPGQPPLGVLVAGLNPNRAMDEDYRTFLGLLAGQVSAALRNARAHEEERARAEALAALDRAKTQFFSNVSHEFRTPLTLMLGPVEEMLALPPEALPSRRAELELVHRNGLRLLKLVNTLLDFSRVEAGRAQARFTAIDVAALTAELASTFRSAIERAGLTFTVETRNPPEPVFLDRDMWEKTVLNLLSNALKHTFTGGIAVTLGPVAGGMELTVSDTGIGISADQLPRIFERFHRIEGARSRSHEGSGIGLALVRELVSLHGGTVTAESAPGEGTRFRIRIPSGTAHLPRESLAPAAASFGDTTARPMAAAFLGEAERWLPGNPAPMSGPHPAEEPAPQLNAAPPATILLADDNADMRAYVERLLGRDHAIITAQDGEEAFALALAREPDLVLTDVMMPRLDGFGLLRRLRAEPALRAIPVIMLSARAGEEAKVQGLDAGADDYLVKPFAAAELLARVRVNLELSRMRRDIAEARHQAQKMDAIGQLTGGIAHDFNNLLMAISGGIDIALRRVEDERVLRVLRNAAVAAGRGATLTRQLLAFARRAPLAIGAVDANALIARMSELLHRTLGGQVEVVTRLAGDLPPVLADETQLELVLLNLAVNARDAMPEGGTLTITTATLPPGTKPARLAPGDYLRITVADTGHGMPADVLERAFEPFFTTKPVGRGTGLGLSQVFGVMSALGGAVEISSMPGEGTSILLHLPVSPTPADEAPPVAAISDGRRARILLVDDDPQVRSASAEMLRELGHAVEDAPGGPEALSILAATPFDLLLTDYAMPVMNGAELAAAARALRPGLAVLLATGYASGDALEAERAAGAVVEKPFRITELAAVIQRALHTAPPASTAGT